jgi:hypothetical protein
MKRIVDKLNDLDVIVPCHFPIWEFLQDNVHAWLEELPLSTLYFGCNNPDQEVHDGLREYLSQFSEIEYIDQRGIKTLGYQLKDLMDRVDTNYFIYCHVDARPTHHSFLVMEADMMEEPKVGIVESERVQFSYNEGEPTPEIPKDYPWYYYKERSFSGYQLINMYSLLPILTKIKDDFIYRNEDIIFQNACEHEGYKYKKSFAMHVHTPTLMNRIWTPKGEKEEGNDAELITYEMQVRGIIKYCEPTELAVNCFFDALAPQYHWYKKKHKKEWDIFEFINEFVMKNNPKWKEALNKRINTGILRYYK